MAIHRLNHAVLFVRDAERAAGFYGEVLGFRRLPVEFPGAVFLQAEGSGNDHDLALFGIGNEAGPSGAGRHSVGLYHLAWEVDTLDDLERIAAALSESGALLGATDHGTTKALYGRDLDGLEFEVCWIVPADLLDPEVTVTSRPLDLEAEKARYGAETPGGIGISRPAVTG